MKVLTTELCLFEKANCIDEETDKFGTSYSTPMVSGALALIWSHNPKLKAKEVKDVLLRNAEQHVKDERDDEVYSYPLLNMMAFLDGESYYTANDINQIVRESYNEIGEILLEDGIHDLYLKHHEIDEAQRIWKSGVDPSSLFYEDMYELLYPKVEHLVAKEGMESLINEKYSIYWQPTTTISFYGPSYDLEVLVKDNEHFIVQQTKEIPPHEEGGEFYNIIYHVKYVKEDGKWKFAGATKEK